MSVGSRITRRVKREESRRGLFISTPGIVGYWKCCGENHPAKTLQHARKLLEQHEDEHHKGKTVGSFGVTKNATEMFAGIDSKIAKKFGIEMIRLDLRKPDEACLLPKEWNGRYPKNSNAKRLRKLSEQQNHRCCYCGKQTWTANHGETGRWQDMATVEHIVPRSRGGTYRIGNIAMACSECNNKRAKNNPVVFMYENQGLLKWELEKI